MSEHELPLSASPARSLAAVLRSQQQRGGGVDLLIAEVTAIPDARHVTVELAGEAVVVPRLVSYAPVVGDACYLLAARSVVIALGGIR